MTKKASEKAIENEFPKVIKENRILCREGESRIEREEFLQKLFSTVGSVMMCFTSILY